MFPLSYISSFARYQPLTFFILLVSTAIAAILINVALVSDPIQLFSQVLYLPRLSNSIQIHLLIQTCTVVNSTPQRRRKFSPTHLLIVLGSGGHTAEMISMLEHAPLDPSIYTHRTYVVSSGDSFSAQKAVEFEEKLHLQSIAQEKEERTTYGGDAAADMNHGHTEDLKSWPDTTPAAKSYTIVTVPRARRIHQSLLTAPFSTLHCLWACISVLRGKIPGQRAHPTYPDLILTNGPATAVCVILGARLLRVLNCMFGSRPNIKEGGDGPTQEPSGALRTIFIESWARVTTLSLSGKIVLPLVDRFLVQWTGLEGKTGWDANWKARRGSAPKRAEYVGALVG